MTINEQIDTIRKNETLDDETKSLLVQALELKAKNDERAEKAKRDRLRIKLFVAHFANGCPECGYKYSPSADEVETALSAVGSVQI